MLIIIFTSTHPKFLITKSFLCISNFKGILFLKFLLNPQKQFEKFVGWRSQDKAVEKPAKLIKQLLLQSNAPLYNDGDLYIECPLLTVKAV